MPPFDVSNRPLTNGQMYGYLHLCGAVSFVGQGNFLSLTWSGSGYLRLVTTGLCSAVTKRNPLRLNNIEYTHL